MIHLNELCIYELHRDTSDTNFYTIRFGHEDFNYASDMMDEFVSNS